VVNFLFTKLVIVELVYDKDMCLKCCLFCYVIDSFVLAHFSETKIVIIDALKIHGCNGWMYICV